MTVYGNIEDYATILRDTISKCITIQQELRYWEPISSIGLALLVFELQGLIDCNGNHGKSGIFKHASTNLYIRRKKTQFWNQRCSNSCFLDLQSSEFSPIITYYVEKLTYYTNISDKPM